MDLRSSPTPPPIMDPLPPPAATTTIRYPVTMNPLHSTPIKRQVGNSILVLQDVQLLLPSGCHNNDQSSTQVDSEDHQHSHQFDKIASNINQTIAELNTIYQEIGYSSNETLAKKQEIFRTIQDSINLFITNLTREKSNIGNEVEWLRQQIRIILSMINDTKGDKNLQLINKGLVFDNRQMYEDGYKQQILNQITAMDSTNPLGIEKQEQLNYMLSSIPTLSLLEKRNRLNKIFLKVLTVFVGIFREFNTANIEYAEIKELIGEHDSNGLLSSLPSKPDAEYHRNILDKFEELTKRLNVEKLPNDHRKERFTAFILASPLKNNQTSPVGAAHHESQLPQGDDFIKLRDINYQLVRIIRGLRFTKITNELISSIQIEIENCKNEIDTRKSTIMGIIEKCFKYIDTLQIKDDQLLKLQQDDQPDNEAYFDLETLNYILSTPENFGLSDENIEFLIGFQNLLNKTIETRQQEWNQHSATCRLLWEKLGESKEYITNFLEKNSSLSDLSLLNFKMELNKLYIKRSEFIESFISDTRLEIEKFWDKMYYSPDMREEFQFFNYSNDTEEDKEQVLNIHEEYLEELKAEFSQKEHIFQSYHELKELLQDQEFLIESSKDSSRLLSKNSCKILLNEEKIRKRINKNLPRLVDSLKKEISEYNNNAIQLDKKTLFINGEDFFEKVLIIESTQHKKPNGNRPNPRTAPRGAPRSGVTSPKKQAPQSNTRKSPVKPTNRPPSSRITKELTSKPRWNSRERTFNNPTTIKLTNALNASLAHNSSALSQSSPLQATRNSPMLGKPPSGIQPLISPLKPSTLVNIKQLTPQARTNPSATTATTAAHIPIGKENNSSPFDLSPIKIRPSFFDQETMNMKSRRVSGITNDTSTLVGDDYLSWRDERIRQLGNEI
ncbi:Anaphase spindle elongation protein [Candida viswanathii]|uniref:Anaphase spindle elongation protein n=1 Tax=Candida viswanathii TaxID=5486 RepID=A0A367XUN9_9ASCO|nr:Anaphase spindle elongation protein [Candida viswanathii]